MFASGAVATTVTSTGVPAGPVWRVHQHHQPRVVDHDHVDHPVDAHSVHGCLIALSNLNFVIRIGAICTIRGSGITTAGNVWVNSNHSLNFNSSANFAVSETGLCDGSTTARIIGAVGNSSNTITVS
jgi:hypothetical protein